MSELSVMTPQEEYEAAERIANLRTEVWRAIFAYPPYADGVAGYVAEQLDPDEVPTKELRRFRKAARALRDRETRANKDAYAKAGADIAEIVSFLDVDAIVSGAITRDLVKLLRGERRGLKLDVRPPRLNSRPFATYVQSIRRAERHLERTKHKFVMSNLRLVVSIARRFNHGRMPLQDLIQEGNIGLMKAVDRFDHRKGFRFSTYGSWWIRHAISRAVADKGRQVRLPVHMIDAYHKVAKAKRELGTREGREPTHDELAEATGLAVAKIEKMSGLLLDQAVSLDKPVSGEDGRRLVDFLEDPKVESPTESIEADAMKGAVRRIMSDLKPIERDILRKRFGLVDDDSLTLKEIGSQYSLSRERIRQLQEQALGKIRRELRNKRML
jgi:RNA polymerase primary sigma factor